MKEYRIIHKTDLEQFRVAVDKYAAEGFTMIVPTQFAIDTDPQERFRFHYIATMEREVEPEEKQ